MKNKQNKFKLIYSILKGLVTVFLILVLLVVIVQRVSKNSFAIGGTRIFTIVSESMLPEYRIGDILILKETDPKEIEIGDHVTYVGKKGDLKGMVITHEVIEKREDDGKQFFITKGIANAFEDPEINEDDIYGKVVYKTAVFSFLGRLMSNLLVYYLLFIIAGVSLSYQVVHGIILNKKESDDVTNE